MQVFKLCLKIIKKNIPVMSIYIIVFLCVSLAMTKAISKEAPQNKGFTRSKSNVAFISEEETPLIEGFRQELSKAANFVDLPDETEALQDALFFRNVSYILRVPEGFTGSFMQGRNDIKLEKTSVPDSYSNAYIDIAIDQYFNIARLYIINAAHISQETLVENIRADLAIETALEQKSFSGKSTNNIYANYFFNYLPYSLLSILIMGMSSLMLVFHDKDLKRRNNCSPLSSYSFNLQFILATLLFTAATWLIMVFFCLLFNLQNAFNLNTFYFIINSFVFALCGASISFLIGNLIRNINAVSSVSNVLTLGLCFISGVFVPMELLGAQVLKIASFTPTYWYVQANNRIAALNSFDFTSVKPVLTNMLIVFTFTLAFFALSLVIGKRRSLE